MSTVPLPRRIRSGVLSDEIKNRYRGRSFRARGPAREAPLTGIAPGWPQMAKSGNRRDRRIHHQTRQSQQILHPAERAIVTPQEKGRIFSEIGEQISHAGRKAGQSAGLGRVRCHDLRHTWARGSCRSRIMFYSLMQNGGDLGRERISASSTAGVVCGAVFTTIHPMSPPKNPMKNVLSKLACATSNPVPRSVRIIDGRPDLRRKTGRDYPKNPKTQIH